MGVSLGVLLGVLVGVCVVVFDGVLVFVGVGVGDAPPPDGVLVGVFDGVADGYSIQAFISSYTIKDKSKATPATLSLNLSMNGNAWAGNIVSK